MLSSWETLQLIQSRKHQDDKCNSSTSLQALWGAVNTQQLVIFGAYFNVNYPANCMVLFNFLSDIAQFSIIPTSQLVQAFNYSDTQTVNQNFEAMGFQGCSFL